MPQPLFHSVSRPHRSAHNGYSVYDVLLGVFVGFLLTATGMHFVYKMPSDDPAGALNASPIGIEEPHYEHGKALSSHVSAFLSICFVRAVSIGSRGFSSAFGAPALA